MKNRIKEFRKARRLSLEQLGERVGVDHTTISRQERSDPVPPTVRAICRELGVYPADILSEADNPDRLSEKERKLIETLRQVPAESRDEIFDMILRMISFASRGSAA